MDHLGYSDGGNRFNLCGRLLTEGHPAHGHPEGRVDRRAAFFAGLQRTDREDDF